MNFILFIPEVVLHHLSSIADLMYRTSLMALTRHGKLPRSIARRTSSDVDLESHQSTMSETQPFRSRREMEKTSTTKAIQND